MHDNLSCCVWRWVTRVVYDDTYQALRRPCVKCSQTVVVVLKNLFWNQETVTELEKLIFRAFRCEMELDYITVSRLLLVPVVNVCESIKNWFQLICLSLSWLLHCVLLPCVYDFETSYVSGSWFVTTVLTLPTCPATPRNFERIFGNDSEAILSRISALCPGGQTFPS